MTQNDSDDDKPIFCPEWPHKADNREDFLQSLLKRLLEQLNNPWEENDGTDRNAEN